MAMPLEDKTASRRILRECYKLPFDPTLVTISVVNGVCYVGGRIRRLRNPEGRGIDLKKFVLDLEDIIRRFPGVRDVVVDAVIED
jgi:hypothetical protein